MSVTLKLKDEDAAVIGDILEAVAATSFVGDDHQMALDLKRVITVANGRYHRPRDIAQLAGAFKVAVRANAK